MKAAGLAEELQNADAGVEVAMKPSSGGVFEVTVGNDLIFSKKSLGRFPEPGEVRARMGL